ncbi:MAG: FecR domain-containing protein [candidate division Zixibacteria bacterium]|nr:FecR domain-containing protein [candidate division Zixibacteria bacterium]
MNRRVRVIILIAVLSFAGFFSDSIFSNQTVVKTVMKGDSISFLSIKVYGLYNEEIAEHIKKANPKIRDLNYIKVDQKISFPPLFDEDNQPYRLKASASNAVITYISGKSFVQRNSRDDWNKVAPNMICIPGDKLKTGENSVVELVLNNSDVMRLSSNTELTLAELAEDPEVPEAKVTFSFGRIWTKVKSYIERSGKFEVEFPTAIAAVQGTVYQAELNPDSTANVKVYHGTVRVANRPTPLVKTHLKKGQIAPPGQVSAPRQVTMKKWVKIVRDMQKISFGPGKPPGSPESFSERWSGEWEKFNRERDARFESQ